MTLANRLAFILICGTLIFTTLAYGAVHQPILAVFYILVAALLILWAVDGFFSGTLRYSRSSLQIPLLASAAYAAIQVIPFGSIASAVGPFEIPRTISLDPFATQVTALHFFALAIFFGASLVILDSASRIRKIVAVIAIFGFVYAFYAILQSVLSPGKIYGIYEVRFASPFGSFVNRHNFAAYMELTMCVPLGLLFTGAVGKDKRLLYLTAVALMGVALLMSGSRGGLVALVAEIILLVMLTTGATSRNKMFLKAGFASLLMVAIVIGSFFIGGESSLTRLAESANSGDVTTERSHIWSVTAKVIAANMPLGAGFGAFGVAYTPLDDFSGLERVEQAHNDYLQVAADAGIPGIIIGGVFLFLLFSIGLTAAKTGNLYRRGVAIGAFAGCFAILVHSLFDFVLHTTAISLLFLLLIALIVACRNSYKDDVETFETLKKRRSVQSNSPAAGSVRRIDSVIKK